MAMKDLLVYVDQTDNSFIRLRLAADLAIRNDSLLTAIFVRELNRDQLESLKAAELGLISAEGVKSLNQRIEASIAAVEERLRSALETLTREHGLMAELRSVDGVAADVVPQHARYADLCILGHEQPEGPASVGYTFAEQLLFVTGRPVLFVPPTDSLKTLGRHIVVAWNSSRPSARSVNDALPLIERSERTTVLMINPSTFIDRHQALPGKRIAEHLSRHGASTDLVRIDDVPPDSIADTLQAEAHKLGADLIVAGAFGHPRLWEKLLGGVTYDLLARMSLPIFMSH